MRVLMMADESFATREHAMLRRVEVGLMDDGVRVVRAVPDQAADPGKSTLATTVAYHDTNWRFVERAHARRLIREISLVEPPLAPAGADPADLLDMVHAWGDACWSIAIDVAAATGAALAFELWSRESVKRIKATERRVAQTAPGVRGVWLAPNARLRAAADEQSPDWPVRGAYWGVHAGEHTHHQRRDDAPIGISIISSGRDETAIRPVLDALSRWSGREGLLIFLDDAAVRNHPGVWKHAQRLGLLDDISIIADMESRRDLILETDVLIVPDALGEIRSIILDAMCSGIVVVARTDPFVEVTAVPDIALLVETPTEEAWRTALDRVIDDPQEIDRIGAKARQGVVRDRPVHKQVESILAAYRGLTDNQPIAFPGSL